MIKKVTTHYLADKEYEIVNESGNKVSIDMYPADEKKALAPMELLLGAAGACAAVDLVEMVKKRRKTVEDLKIESTGKRRDTVPKSYESINLHFILKSPDCTEDEFTKLVKLAVEKYCSVTDSLKGRAEVTFTSEVQN
ncbi:OsmC family protein [Mangrovivirga sp. M17]|uniref:OsmC family protein n=1 Tax=Mangrovivirga halotolerans TaxID=2993936 RepID=A0ABT3RM09_9BACT|nr:OsmC family protein [Mangrovivirga halotolerans]MCX2742548.1 OsmC family protein [Mangrovivirga halotolerans]